MNHQLIKSYIQQYKQEFHRIHSQEIYKWKAIKQFQDNFDIETSDFHGNLEISLSKVSNLLDSGQYFPKRMLLANAEKSPEKVREMFRILYDEDFDLLERIKSFRADIKKLNRNNFGKKNDYQDPRAVIVYLTLRYPERYFFYKYRMFRDFIQKIEYPFNPVQGKLENNSQFQTLGNLVRHEIEQDQELLKLHQTRLDEECYQDINHFVLTQDFIYATVKYLNSQIPEPKTTRTNVIVTEVKSVNLKINQDAPDFTPKIVNYIQNSIENKRIGDLGELWVLQHERDFLISKGKPKLAEKVKHDAVDLGDGLGYDILSFDINGNKKYIEVKTTKGKANSIFYVTRNELERSKKEQNSYYLYRVYDFDDINNTGKIVQIQGELTSICEIPVNYKVSLKTETSE